jgi:predicted nucleotidyltransferase
VSATAHILQQIKASILSTDPGATLILYGSYARGDNRKDSDIDILVLLDQDKITLSDRERIGDPLYDIQLETDTLITPVIYTRNTWNTRLKITPFYKNVTRDGILL